MAELELAMPGGSIDLWRTTKVPHSGSTQAEEADWHLLQSVEYQPEYLFYAEC